VAIRICGTREVYCRDVASRLAETIVRWLGRVEVVLAGVDGALRDGQDALASGDAMRARSEARLILERIPASMQSSR
jgi:hypothetical protein